MSTELLRLPNQFDTPQREIQVATPSCCCCCCCVMTLFGATTYMFRDFERQSRWHTGKRGWFLGIFLAGVMIALPIAAFAFAHNADGVLLTVSVVAIDLVLSGILYSRTKTTRPYLRGAVLSIIVIALFIAEAFAFFIFFYIWPLYLLIAIIGGPFLAIRLTPYRPKVKETIDLEIRE